VKLPGGRKAIILIGLPLGLAAAGAIVFTQMSAKTPPVPDPKDGQHGPMLALDERVINLQNGGSYHYAKVGITVELRPPTADFYALDGASRATAEKTILTGEQGAVPLLLDAIGTVVSSKTSEDLIAANGRGALKAQILESMRTVLGSRAVLDVYFTDLVMQ
jgi:flagellar basal body-associated protein FliL